MRKVTDPKILQMLESESNNNSKKVTDPVLLSQLEGRENIPQNINQSQPPSPLPWSLGSINTKPHPERVLRDILAGSTQFGQVLHNAPYKVLTGMGVKPENMPEWTKPTDINWSEYYGISNPTYQDRFIQELTESLPTTLAGGGSILGQVLSGATYGGLSSENPVIGTTIGGLGGLVGGALGKALTPSTTRNILLNKISKAAKKGGALTPEEAARNIELSYTAEGGKRMDVDIGTATNYPFLQNVSQGLKYVPFSGAATSENKLLSQMAEQAKKSYEKEVGSEITDITHQLQQHEIANKYINNLNKDIGNPQKIITEQKKSLTNVFDNELKQAVENYKPINESKFNISEFAKSNNIKNPFPSYTQSLKDLYDQKDNLINIFGNSSDMGTLLNNEFHKGLSTVTGTKMKKFSLELPEVITRLQKLGKATSTAYSSGKRNEARMLNQLRTSLEEDTHNLLNSSGNQDLSNQLLMANDFYKKNILPFYKDREIKKIVTDKSYLPSGSRLSTILHNPNNSQILNKLPEGIKNSSLFMLMTKGKTTSKGLSNLDAKEIASRYESLPMETKQVISSYNPNADTYFEKLSDYLSPSKSKESLSDRLKDVLKNKESKLIELEKQKYGRKRELGAEGKLSKDLTQIGTKAALAKIFGTSLLPLSLVGRKLNKMLYDPKLIEKYIAKERYPTTNIPAMTLQDLLTSLVTANRRK